MIRNIKNGPGIHITGNYYNQPWLVVDMSRPSAGIVRYNSSDIEVYDGASWQPMVSCVPYIELDGPTLKAVRWAQRKMEEENACWRWLNNILLWPMLLLLENESTKQCVLQ